MFKSENFETEIAIQMAKKLREPLKLVIDKKAEQALELLNKAGAVFEKAGFISEAAEIKQIINKVSGINND